jgi:Eco29kI restriction endonuclease
LAFDASRGKALRDRLRQHAASIDEAINIDLEDFHCRSLIVDDVWIPLGESMMIEQFRPIWNLVIDGFGNKDPGKRRATQYRSLWDVLHPGRQFAEKLADGAVTPEMLTIRLEEYFGGQTVPLIPSEEAADIGTTVDEDDES